MRHLRAAIVRLVGLFRRRSIDADMQAEMESHIDGLTERNLAAGMSSGEARNAALREFGGVTQILERSRDQRRSLWGEHLSQDIKYCLRSLLKTPSFTVTAAVTLGLGIGVNTGLFGLFNMFALRSPAVPDPNRLVRIDGRTNKGSIDRYFSYAEYLRYSENLRSMSGVLAYGKATYPLSTDILANVDFEPEGFQSIGVEFVSNNYFDLLGAQIVIGRTFSPEELQTPGAAAVIVLSYQHWQQYFQGRADILGTTVSVDRRVVTVVGVAAPEFTGQAPVPPTGWLPLGFWSDRPVDYGPNGPRRLHLIGRLNAGVSIEAAKSELDLIASAWASEFPSAAAKQSVRLDRGLKILRFDRTPAGLILLSTVFFGFGLVLAIACTNVANLLLARGVSRQSEIGIRLTLGAGRGRILRQLLTENCILCIIGGCFGLALAVWTQQLTLPFVVEQLGLSGTGGTKDLPLFDLTPDLRMMGFAAVLTIGCTLAAGLVPALHAADANLISTVRNDGTAFGGRFSPSKLRKFLVIAQVAICVTLLSSAGILIRSFLSTQKADVGFDPDAVFEVAVSPNEAIGEPAQAFRHALDTLRSIPNVVDAAVANRAPLMGRAARPSIKIALSGGEVVESQTNAAFVSSGFFDTFGIALYSGRTFLEFEQNSAAQVVVVSQALARQLWPNQDPIGKTVMISESAWAGRERRDAVNTFRECEVIGIARDVVIEEMSRYNEDHRQLMYLPYALNIRGPGMVYVRPRSDSGPGLAAIVQAGRASGLGVRFQHRHSFWVNQVVMAFYGLSCMSGALAALAIVMSAVGLYGLMSFAVNQRVREIGVRMALGASTDKVVTLFVKEGMRLVGIGIGLGLVGGHLFAIVLDKIFFGQIDAFEPSTFLCVGLLFAVIGILACWLPARRAARVDPMVALRC